MTETRIAQPQPAMHSDSGDPSGNLLLRSLSPPCRAALAPFSEHTSLVIGDRMASAGEELQSLCFPEGGIVALIDHRAGGEGITTGIIGREGFVGWPLLFHETVWPHDAIVRGCDISAIRIHRDGLAAAGPEFHAALLGHVREVIAQMTGTIASNLLQSVEERTARWIMLYAERLDGDEIVLTHQELGIMLGVRRSSITDALHRLQGHGAIRGYRGRVQIVDRALLARVAHLSAGDC
jgi:CRP-like cAMP-binding protein